MLCIRGGMADLPSPHFVPQARIVFFVETLVQISTPDNHAYKMLNPSSNLRTIRRMRTESLTPGNGRPSSSPPTVEHSEAAADADPQIPISIAGWLRHSHSDDAGFDEGCRWYRQAILASQQVGPGRILTGGPGGFIVVDEVTGERLA